MTRLLSVVFFLISILVGTSSCKKLNKYSDPTNISESSWNPILAVPLAHATFGVYDILARTDSSELVIIDDNSGEIALVYKGEVVSFDAEEIISIPDAQTQFTYDMADFGIIPIPSFIASANTTSSETFDINPGNGVEIHTITFKEGSLGMQLTTDLRHDLTINISFPELIKNGQPINETVNLIYSGSVPQTISHNISLVDAIGDFTINNTTVNEIVGEVSITMTGTGEPVSSVESIQAEIEFSNLKYRNATGYFGQQSLGGHQDSILLRIFTAGTDGYFELTNPKIRLEMINSFGFPADVLLSNVKTVNQNTGQEYVLTGYPTAISIAAPSVIGQTETTIVELNNSNTNNLSTVITPVPKYFHFEANGISNPDGPTSTLNFIEDTSKFRINAEVELPLEGFAYGFKVTDTVDFDFSDDIEEISSILFRLIVNNGFPVDLFTGITFVDENYLPLLELTDGSELVVESAQTNTSGAVNQSTEKITDLTIQRNDVPLLEQAKYIILSAEAQSLNGSDGEIVKFFDFYTISLKLGMKVQTNVTF